MLLHLLKPILPEPRPSAKSQVDTPAPGVCRSLFPRGNVLKAEIVRLVAGLGVLEQHPVRVEGLVYHHCHAIIAVHIQQLFITGSCVFHRDAPFAGDDLHSKHVFNKIIDGMGCDFLCQSGYKFL